jgi:hypothetical protein
MRVYNIIFIIIFIAIILFPLIFIDLKHDRMSVQENRMLAKQPDLSDIIKNPSTFRRQFDSWFKDSTGFREQMLSIYNSIEKSKFFNSIQFIDGQYLYLFGEQGHVYFADVNGSSIPKFQGKPYLSEKQLYDLSNKLEEINQYLKEKNIPFVVMFCADKESIFPEFYPRAIIRGPEPIQLEIITNYVKQNTSIDVFNLRSSFLTKKDYLLYPVSSGDLTHYTEIGGFFAYCELMKHITPYFPDIIPYTLNDITINNDEKDNPKISINSDINYKRLDSSFFDDIPLLRPFIWENHAYKNISIDQPVILFFSDSYAAENYIGKYFAQQFGKTIFIHLQNEENFYNYIEYYKPDIVVFESAERNLNWFSSIVTIVPDITNE